VLRFSGTKATVGANDFLQDVVGLGSPHEWFGILVMHGDVLLDSEDEIEKAAKYAPSANVRW
jgi:hypothetical protein